MDRKELKQQGDRLYEQYCKPLEADHWGEFVSVTADGKTMLGDDLRTLLVESTKEFGKGGFIFKVGPRVVGNWRRTSGSLALASPSFRFI